MQPSPRPVLGSGQAPIVSTIPSPPCSSHLQDKRGFSCGVRSRDLQPQVVTHHRFGTSRDQVIAAPTCTLQVNRSRGGAWDVSGWKGPRRSPGSSPSSFVCAKVIEKKKRQKKTTKPNKPNPTSSSASVGRRPKTQSGEALRSADGNPIWGY